MAWSNTGNIKGPAGSTGSQGIQGPQGNPGTTGAQGTAGTAGARGSQWFTGAGAPGVIGGSAVGDMYLNTTNGDVYTLS